MATGFQLGPVCHVTPKSQKLKKWRITFGSFVFFLDDTFLSNANKSKIVSFLGVVRGVSFTLEITFFVSFILFAHSRPRKERENGPLPSLRRFSGE
jgi:hypothetical protein